MAGGGGALRGGGGVRGASAITIWVRLFVLLPVWSLLTAVWCSLLVLPMGYLAQRAMRWAAEKED